MSKVTNPSSEGSVTCGFFNSINDRKYNAEQMSSIFDGLINDGVFASIGDTLVVSASSGNTVSVGTGKCWFDGTWTLNDAPLLIDCGSSEPLQTRIDAIVVEVNKNDNVRDNFIKLIKGTASQYNPVKPELKKEERRKQYALCYITRTPGSTEIIPANIENVIGTAETPFVTGIVQVTSLDALLGQWTDELNRYIASGKVKIDNYIASEENDFDAWYADMKQMMSDVSVELNDWTAAEKTTIMNWFNTVKGQLSEDPALSLQIQIDAATVERLLVDGLSDGTKTFSEDGTIITSVDSKGRVLTKTFTNEFRTITSVLKDRGTTEYVNYPYYNTTITRDGITFTDNGDGSVTANGTATAKACFYLNASSYILDKGIYSISGCPNGGSADTYSFVLDFLSSDSGSIGHAEDVGFGASIDAANLDYTYSLMYIKINSGTSVSNLTFYPSVRTTGSELGTLVKEISTDGKLISSTLINNADSIPNLVEIERSLDTIIATENSYIGGDNA